MTLKIDPERKNFWATGIFVRAMDATGRYGSYDISELDFSSLQSWLRSTGGENLLAERTVALLLGHKVN